MKWQGTVVEIIGSESKWVHLLVLPLKSFMTLGKFLNFSVAWFIHLFYEDYNSVYLMGLGEVRGVACCLVLVCAKCIIKVSSSCHVHRLCCLWVGSDE